MQEERLKRLMEILEPGDISSLTCGGEAPVGRFFFSPSSFFGLGRYRLAFRTWQLGFPMGGQVTTILGLHLVVFNGVATELQTITTRYI